MPSSARKPKLTQDQRGEGLQRLLAGESATVTQLKRKRAPFEQAPVPFIPVCRPSKSRDDPPGGPGPSPFRPQVFFTGLRLTFLRPVYRGRRAEVVSFRLLRLLMDSSFQLA